MDINNINNYIDQCNYHLTHYDVALIVFKVFKKCYRYIGKHKWEYFDTNDNMWKKDERKNKLITDIKTIIADLFITRATYWYNISKNNNNDINTIIHENFMAEKMIRAGNKIKNNNFIAIVIKEAEPFFDIHNE